MNAAPLALDRYSARCMADSNTTTALAVYSFTDKKTAEAVGVFSQASLAPS
jgi:hypothetical protein